MRYGGEILDVIKCDEQNNVGLTKLKVLYDLDIVKVQCRCIVHKWKSCLTIKNLAGGCKLNSKLLISHTLAEVLNTNVKSCALLEEEGQSSHTPNKSAPRVPSLLQIL